MSSFPSTCETLHESPSSRAHSCCDPVGVIMCQGAFVTHDHGQMLEPEFSLTEMSDVDYTHLQHLNQANIASPDSPDARPHPAAVMVKDAAVISPVLTTQAIDLSTSTDDHCLVMPGENTPASYGAVPGFVLARVRGEDSPTEPRADSSTSSQMRSRSAARVCLEKRFSTLAADTPRQQDIQCAVLNNFLTMLQQSADAQEAVIHPQMQKWMKTEGSSPYVGGQFNPVPNMCEQVIGHIPHMVEPNKHQGLIIPKSFSITFRPERVVAKALGTSGGKSTEEQQQLGKIGNDVETPIPSGKHASTQSSQPVKAASAAPDSAGESGSGSRRKRARAHMSLIQRRERHNSKERERRRRIRAYCDELKMLVPFCDSDTDKVTTLQWTAAFLRYIKKMYGDTFKEEFQKAFVDRRRHFLPSNPSSGQGPIHWEMDEGIPLVVEQ